MSAAYLGPTASFSHQAALAIFSGTDTQVEALPTFADVFEGVQSAHYKYGVVPFENSSNGSVVQLLDLFADRQMKYNDLKVCAEYYLPIHHQLLVKPHTRYATSGLEEALRRMKKIYSHPQVWGQCSTFLSRDECRPIVKQDCSSTSEAARVVADSDELLYGAIASELAGKEYGLVNLAPNVEDEGDNTTRFFVVARTGADLIPPTVKIKSDGDTRSYKNLVSFTIEHESPGALAVALSIFKKHKFNLTSINTRPSRLPLWHYIFFAECEQRPEKHGADAVIGLISNLAEVAMSCRHLGTWEDQLATH